jgi:hypothetical protein
MKLEFSGQISKKDPQIQIYRKFFQWEPTCSMGMEGHTDMAQLIVTFLKFADVPKI